VPCIHKHTEPEEYDSLVGIAEAAQILSVSMSTLRRWDREGILTAYRTPTGQRRYRRSDLDAAINQNPA
jgi:excisionase family DNA binding protein